MASYLSNQRQYASTIPTALSTLEAQEFQKRESQRLLKERARLEEEMAIRAKAQQYGGVQAAIGIDKYLNQPAVQPTTPLAVSNGQIINPSLPSAFQGKYIEGLAVPNTNAVPAGISSANIPTAPVEFGATTSTTPAITTTAFTDAAAKGAPTAFDAAAAGVSETTVAGTTGAQATGSNAGSLMGLGTAGLAGVAGLGFGLADISKRGLTASNALGTLGGLVTTASVGSALFGAAGASAATANPIGLMIGGGLALGGLVASFFE